MQAAVKRTVAVVFLVVVAIALSCGKVAPKMSADAPITSDTARDVPAGPHDCGFDSDTFDNGCTFAP